MAKWGSRQMFPPPNNTKVGALDARCLVWTCRGRCHHSWEIQPYPCTQTGDWQTVTTYQNRSQPARTSTETKLGTGSWHCLMHYTLVRASLPSPLTGFVRSGYVMVEVGRKEIPFWAQRGPKELFGVYTGALGYITVGPQKLIPQSGLMEVYQIRTDLREDE